MNNTFVKTLSQCAFGRLDISNHQIDMQGWMEPTFKLVFSTIVQHVSKKDAPLTIIEIGTWKGLSTITMAQTCLEMQIPDFAIITVDTWLGAPEFWTWGLHDTTRGISLNCKDGYPSVFYTFTKNVKATGLDKYIAPLPISSIQGAEVLLFHKVQADAIYVDAAHEYDAVIADLHAYYPIVRNGGIMFGDDYCDNWPGVQRAVNEFATLHQLDVKFSGVVWWFVKP